MWSRADGDQPGDARLRDRVGCSRRSTTVRQPDDRGIRAGRLGATLHRPARRGRVARLVGRMTRESRAQEGSEIEHHGKPLRIPWVREGASCPCGWAAVRAEALSLVGEQPTGSSPAGSRPDDRSVDVRVSAAPRRKAAGRDPSSIRVRGAPAYFGDDPSAHQREQLRGSAGCRQPRRGTSSHGRTDGPVGRTPSPTTSPAARPMTTSKPRQGRETPRRTSSRRHSATRFWPGGPAAAHIERLRELGRYRADQFALYLMHVTRKDARSLRPRTSSQPFDLKTAETPGHGRHQDRFCERRHEVPPPRPSQRGERIRLSSRRGPAPNTYLPPPA